MFLFCLLSFSIIQFDPFDYDPDAKFDGTIIIRDYQPNLYSHSHQICSSEAPNEKIKEFIYNKLGFVAILGTKQISGSSQGMSGIRCWKMKCDDEAKDFDDCNYELYNAHTIDGYQYHVGYSFVSATYFYKPEEITTTFTKTTRKTEVITDTTTTTYSIVAMSIISSTSTRIDSSTTTVTKIFSDMVIETFVTTITSTSISTSSITISVSPTSMPRYSWFDVFYIDDDDD